MTAPATAAGLSAVQRDRIAAYRRSQTQHSPDSLSDSQGGGRVGREPFFGGETRNLDRPPAASPWNAAVPSGASAPSGTVLTPSGPTPSRPNQAAAAKMPLSATSNELTSYIFRLEQQNDELRRQLVSVSEGQAGSPAAGAQSAVSRMIDRGEEGKRQFLNDVLAQVESVITAHKNKAQAEINRYKHEAEAAQLALKNLREAIQQEGMDLTMAPAMIAFQRKQQQDRQRRGAEANEEQTPLGLQISPDAQALLEQLSAELLAKLLTLKSSDDVPATVGQAVKQCFEGIVVHFTDQICRNTSFLDEANELLRRELHEARDDVRRLESAHEARRIDLVTRHDAEIQALRDEIACYQRANGDTTARSGGAARRLPGGVGQDEDLSANVHQRAFDEYAQLLTDARRDVQSLRLELENERNHSAQVCLKLKAALQKRNDEFEKAVVSRAEDVVQQRERRIAELEKQLLAKEPPSKIDVNIQVGESLVGLPGLDQFVPQLLASVKKDPHSTRANNDLFEREVWRKTHELLTKYGNSVATAALPPQPSPPLVGLPPTSAAAPTQHSLMGRRGSFAQHAPM